MPAWKGIIGKGFTAAQFPDYVAGTKFGAWRPQFIVLHNTFIPKLSEWHSVPGAQRMKALEHFYRDIQKWSAGPHLFVADDLIWAFTPLNVSGVHSPSWNTISWGVELVGDYSVEQLSPALKENAVSALAALHSNIGLDPNSAFLRGTLELDEYGFVVDKGSFRTSMPGVFVAGDVRRGSTKQLGAAVGDGVAALLAIREYLQEHHQVAEHPDD